MLFQVYDPKTDLLAGNLELASSVDIINRRVKKVISSHLRAVAPIFLYNLVGVVPSLEVIEWLRCVIGLLGRQGLAASPGQHCP